MDDQSPQPGAAPGATLGWASHEIDTAEPSLIQARLGPLSAEDSPWRPIALQYLAMLDIRIGHKAEAANDPPIVANDISTPEDMRNMANGLAEALGAPPPPPNATSRPRASFRLHHDQPQDDWRPLMSRMMFLPKRPQPAAKDDRILIGRRAALALPLALTGCGFIGGDQIAAAAGQADRRDGLLNRARRRPDLDTGCDAARRRGRAGMAAAGRQCHA